MDLALADRRALVTAATRGTGVAVARALAEEGCQVLVHGRDAEAAQAVAAAVGGEVVPRDLTDPVAAAVAFVCSPRADYVNGTELRVDGGLSPLV